MTFIFKDIISPNKIKWSFEIFLFRGRIESILLIALSPAHLHNISSLWAYIWNSWLSNMMQRIFNMNLFHLFYNLCKNFFQRESNSKWLQFSDLFSVGLSIVLIIWFWILHLPFKYWCFLCSLFLTNSGFFFIFFNDFYGEYDVHITKNSCILCSFYYFA